MTSVCTGALVLGAAGLLDGYQATTHWGSIDNLAHFGATAVNTRVCVDRNRITGGGVTAGLDFGLHLASVLADRQTAERIQLFLEYTPQPPFTSGSPDTAPKEVLAKVSETIAPMLTRRKEATLRAAQRLKGRHLRAGCDAGRKSRDGKRSTSPSGHGIAGGRHSRADHRSRLLRAQPAADVRCGAQGRRPTAAACQDAQVPDRCASADRPRGSRRVLPESIRSRDAWSRRHRRRPSLQRGGGRRQSSTGWPRSPATPASRSASTTSRMSQRSSRRRASSGVRLSVLVEIDVGARRCGTSPREQPACASPRRSRARTASLWRPAGLSRLGAALREAASGATHIARAPI